MTDKVPKEGAGAIRVRGVRKADISGNTYEGSGAFLDAKDIGDLRSAGNTVVETAYRPPIKQETAQEPQLEKPTEAKKKFVDTFMGRVSVGLVILAIASVLSYLYSRL